MRREYEVGDRVRLLRLTDQYSSLPIGTLGTVSLIDDRGTVHVRWDTGALLGIVYEAGDRIILVPNTYS